MQQRPLELVWLTAESNRHGRTADSVNRAIAAHVRWLRKQLADLDAALERAIRNSPSWSEKAGCFAACRRWAVSRESPFLAHLPELGTINRRKTQR
jgi:hypothetical protein